MKVTVTARDLCTYKFEVAGEVNVTDANNLFVVVDDIRGGVEIDGHRGTYLMDVRDLCMFFEIKLGIAVIPYISINLKP